MIEPLPDGIKVGDRVIGEFWCGFRRPENPGDVMIVEGEVTEDRMYASSYETVVDTGNGHRYVNTSTLRLRDGQPGPGETPRGDVLLEARDLVTGDRNKSYGHPTRNFDVTAELWNAQFGHKLKEPLTAEDVALAMIHLKMARLANPGDGQDRPASRRDQYVDIAGYAACGHETALPGDPDA